MGPTLCTVLTVLIMLVAVCIGLYLNWQCPPLSNRLALWNKQNSGYFTMKSKTVFYKDVKSESGTSNPLQRETLVLLHGFPTMSYDWVKMWPGLTSQFGRVIAVDFLGFGFSDKPLNYNYTIMEQADYVVSLLRAIRVNDFHILAHDYGDTVAQELLHRQNQGEISNIKSACLLNGGVFPETHQPRPLQKLALSPWLGPIVSQLSNRYIFGHGLSDVFGPDTKPTDADIYDFWCGYCNSRGYTNSANMLDYINQRKYNKVRWRLALQQSKVPVHFIYGPADPVNPPAFVDFYKENVPKGTIDVLDVKIGHYVQWEQSDRVLQLYLDFVRKVQA